jgi:hypothetical protein
MEEVLAVDEGDDALDRGLRHSRAHPTVEATKE